MFRPKCAPHSMHIHCYFISCCVNSLPLASYDDVIKWKHFPHYWPFHYHDVIMGSIASQITSLTIVYSTVYSDADQRKHQSSASLAFVREIHRGPVNFPHKWPVTRKMFPFDDVIMCVGNSPVPGEFPSQRPVTRGFDVLFDLHMNKRLSKQSRRWWFETPLHSLWRHHNRAMWQDWITTWRQLMSLCKR